MYGVQTLSIAKLILTYLKGTTLLLLRRAEPIGASCEIISPLYVINNIPLSGTILITQRSTAMDCRVHLLFMVRCASYYMKGFAQAFCSDPEDPLQHLYDIDDGPSLISAAYLHSSQTHLIRSQNQL